ncbi:uncharacterized protein [Miscanthus floridulus]|uniref:uncharacterized protein n=1 Tax=Miscanthus floridulus TaxID=154761 RepID=UPI003458A572
MATFCALHDIEAKEKAEGMAMEGPKKALRAVNLDKPRAQVHLGRVGGKQEQRWYLDSDANNHMMGSKAAFSELNYDVTGMVNIINIGQLDERGSEVLIKDGILKQRLLAKVKRFRNQLYLFDLKVEHPIYLAAWCTEEPWLWHAQYGHLGFDALGWLEKMVTGLPHIEHAGELCDSCLTEKQRWLPFPKMAKYRTVETLKLVHGDLYGPITPATLDGRKYFILLVDDCNRYMWL